MISIDKYIKIYRYRNLFHRVSTLSYYIKKLGQDYPLTLLDEEMAKKIIYLYELMIEEAREIIKNINKYFDNPDFNREELKENEKKEKELYGYTKQNLVIKYFRLYKNFNPTDKKARNWAFLISRKVDKFLEDYRTDLVKLKLFDFERIIELYFNFLKKQDYFIKIEKLETVYRKMDIYLASLKETIIKQAEAKKANEYIIQENEKAKLTKEIAQLKYLIQEKEKELKDYEKFIDDNSNKKDIEDYKKTLETIKTEYEFYKTQLYEKELALKNLEVDLSNGDTTS